MRGRRREVWENRTRGVRRTAEHRPEAAPGSHRPLAVDRGDRVANAHPPRPPALTALQPEPEPSSIEELDRKSREASKPKRPKWLIAAIASGVALAVAAGVGALGGQTERPAAKTTSVPSRAVSRTPSTPRIAAPVPAARARVTLVVVALAPTRVSIQADGAQIFDGTMVAGESRTFRARSAVDIVAADGGTVRLTLNGVALGRAGPNGSVFRARYGPHGKISGA
ncbi:MAG: DUF4115 domain-containing protein [Actinobacteria bacterium]|nr:MAG: DUF4115 domain-containing protein [Actinomycetota bacterium]